MIALTRKADEDLEAFAGLFGYKTKALEALSMLSEFPGAGLMGRAPDTRELPLGELPFLAVYGVRAGEVIIYRVLPAPASARCQ